MLEVSKNYYFEVVVFASVLFGVLICGGNEFFVDGVGCCLCGFFHV